jgi:hypothetical protein
LPVLAKLPRPHPDHTSIGRLEAMLQMKKLDFATLEKAYAGA